MVLQIHSLFEMISCFFKKINKILTGTYLLPTIFGGGIGMSYSLTDAKSTLHYTSLSKIECFSQVWWYIPTGATIALFLSWLHQQHTGEKS